MLSPGLAGTSSSHGHQPAEVFRKDLISAMKLPDSYQLQPEEYMVIMDTWKQDWEKGVQVPVNPGSIPSIDCMSIKENDQGNFKMPKKYICISSGAVEQDDFAASFQKKLESVCQYDLDEVDDQWLEIVNQERCEMGDAPIDEFTVEQIVEECEMQCHKNMDHAMMTEEGLGIEYDDDVICDVCRAPDCEEGNEMVFCDKCDICVHQACYGIVKVPEGSWMCRTCALGIQPLCLLCGQKGGAMKSTRSGTKWAHVSCALWIPEVSIGCVERMEPITKISQIPVSRWALICNLCRLRTGACIQCSVKTCKTAYHVTCGFKHGLEMKTFLDDEADVKFRSYCLKHSRKRNADSDTDGTPQKSSGGQQTNTPRKEKSIEEKDNERAIRIQNVTEDFYKFAKVKDVAASLNMKEDLEVVDLVFEYWKLKRKSGFNRPLVVLQKEESPSTNEEYSLHARMRMFLHLRQDLERVRNLCYMVQKREKLSRQMAKLRQDIFKKQKQIVSGDTSHLSREDLEVVEQSSVLQLPEKTQAAFDLFSDISLDDVKMSEELKYDDLGEAAEFNCNGSSPSTSPRRGGFRTTELPSSGGVEHKAANASNRRAEETSGVKRSVTVEREDLPAMPPSCASRGAPASMSGDLPTPHHAVSLGGNSLLTKQRCPAKRSTSDVDRVNHVQTKRARNGRCRSSKTASQLKSGTPESNAPKQAAQLKVNNAHDMASSSRQTVRHPRPSLSPRQLQMQEEGARLREQMFASSPASRAILSGYRIPKKKSIPSSESSPPPAVEADNAATTTSCQPEKDLHLGTLPETRSVRRRIEDELDQDSNSSDRQFENIDSEVSICRKGKKSPSCSDDGEADDIIVVDDDHRPELIAKHLTAAAKIAKSQPMDSCDVNNRVNDNQPAANRLYGAAYCLLNSNSAMPL